MDGERDGREERGPTSLPARRAGLSRERIVHAVGELAPLPVAFLALTAPLAWLGGPMLPAIAAIGVSGLSLLWAMAPFAPVTVGWLARSKRAGDVPVQLDRKTLRAGDLTIPIDRMAVAWNPSRCVVEIIDQQGNELELVMRDDEQARWLVATLRRAIHGRAYPLRLDSDASRLARKLFGWLVPVTAALPFVWLGPPLLGAAALSVASVLGALFTRGRKRVRFGADGVVIEGRFRRRYVAYSEIASVRRESTLPGVSVVRLGLKDGSSVALGRLIRDQRAELLTALLEEGVSMHAAGVAAGAHVAALDRGEDAPAGWRARVESAARDTGYRGVALDAERLLTLMRNPAATPEQRVAAALALRSSDKGVARIRVAADVSAEPAVRDAFQRLAEEELDELEVERVLDRLGRAS